jgi:hypothetical protein
VTETPNATEGFTVICGWCHRQVVNFVNPPAMIEIVADPGIRHEKQFWRICLQCYTELIKLIAGLDWRSEKPG